MTILDCDPGTVPGWLDENDNPTSCVGDLPNPEVLDGEPSPMLEPLPDITSGPSPVDLAPSPSAEPLPAASETTAAPVQPVGPGGLTSLPETGAPDVVLLIVLIVGVLAGMIGTLLLRRPRP